MQISVAHSCGRPAEFLCKMHKATPSDIGGGLFARFSSLMVFVVATTSILAYTQTILGCFRFGWCCHLLPARHWHWDGVR